MIKTKKFVRARDLVRLFPLTDNEHWHLLLHTDLKNGAFLSILHSDTL